MIKISSANTSDIAELVTLINSGYRGEASRAGWTTEADLLKGEQRIDTLGLTEMMDAGQATVLKAVNENDRIVGCVYLQQQEKDLYLGLLTVSPNFQALGIGRSLMAFADKFALEVQCSRIYMTVISLRKELITWYERNGYRITGETIPFPDDPRFGIPTQPLELLIMDKQTF